MKLILPPSEPSPESSPVPSVPRLLPRLARWLGISLSAALLIIIAATVGVSCWLWHAVSGGIQELADGTGMNRHLVEFLRRLGQAFIIAGAGFFLTLSIRRWQRGMFSMLLVLALIPLLIFAVAMVRGIGADGHPLTMKQMDPVTSEWFEGKTGAPVLWCGSGDDSEPEFFNCPGSHPRTGVRLEPVTTAQRAEWVRQRRAEAEGRAAAEAARKALESRRQDEETAKSLTAQAQAEAAKLREEATRVHEEAKAEAEETRRKSLAEVEERKRAAEAALQQAEEEALRKAKMEILSAPSPASQSEYQTPPFPVSERQLSAKAAPRLSTEAPAPPAPDEFELRFGLDLNLNVHGDKVKVWSNGPIQVSANDGGWEIVPDPAIGMLFEGQNDTIHIRPLSRDATTLWIRKLP